SSTDGTIFITTGWSARGFIPLLPVIPYLACLLPPLRESARGRRWLKTGLYANVLVSWSSPWQFSMDADLYAKAWHNADYGIHLVLILLAVICRSIISVLLGLWLRRGREPA